MDVKGFEISGKGDALEDVVSKLKFISKLKEGDKICVASMTVVKSDYYSRLCRTISNTVTSDEGREKTMYFVRGVIKKAIDLAHYYAQNNYQECAFNKNITELIIRNINNAKKGLDNLSKTYSESTKFTTELETIMETMDIKINST